MSAVTLLLIAIGVSADAFAVSLGKGLQLTRLRLRVAVVLALTFGVFQGVMPLIGYLLASTLRDTVTAVDHWVAFVLLSGLGGKMIWDALRADSDVDSDADASTDPDGPAERELPVGELLLLGLATSIDALAVGISLAFLDVQIASTVILIGVTTFVLSLAGVYVGHRVGTRVRKPAEVAGGVVLIAIGVKVLLDHLGIW